MALGSQAGARQLLLLEARVNFLEQILFNLGVIADPPPSDMTRLGGGETVEALRRFGPGPIVDRATPDTTRLEALLRLVSLRPPPGDRATPDLARLSTAEIEGAVHHVNAEIVRLRSLESLLNERLKELRGKSGGGSENATAG